MAFIRQASNDLKRGAAAAGVGAHLHAVRSGRVDALADVVPAVGNDLDDAAVHEDAQLDGIPVWRLERRHAAIRGC